MSAGAARPVRHARGGRLRLAYVEPLARLGRLRMFSTSRYARFGFLTALRGLERRLGAPEEARWSNGRSGTRFLCDLRDNLQSELFYLGSYAEDAIARLARFLAPGDVVIDVGAHVGSFAVEIVTRLGGDTQVIAFEPSPDSASSLRRNAEANGASAAISVFELALGEAPGTAPLRVAHDHPHDAGRRSLFADGAIHGYVAVHALDELVESGAVRLTRGLHAIKIDVEGSETAVVRGMSRTIARERPRAVLVETVSENLRRGGSWLAELTGLMRELGYVASDDPRSEPLDTIFVPAQAGSG